MCEKINWINGRINIIKKWKNNLFSIIFNAEINKFKPGQFGRIKICYLENKLIRAYSYINSPNDKNLEFYIKKIKNGIVSKILYNLKKNDIIKISKNSYGLLILEKITFCNTLWMFATGTGIGPYVSILKSEIDFNKINKIILIYSVKFNCDLHYIKDLKKIKKNNKNNLFIITITSKEISNNSLHGRIPELIKNGYLEYYSNTKINNENDYFMICGNPEMIENTKHNLINFKNINNDKIIFEKYWK